jgi:hypothetical protein
MIQKTKILSEFFQPCFPPFLQVTYIKICVFSKDMLIYYNNSVIHNFLHLHSHQVNDVEAKT